MDDSRTLLLVEDDEDLRTGLVFALEREGYTVHAVVNVAEAKTLLRSVSVHLVILDVMLPDGSGFDLCRALRSSGWAGATSGATPVIFLTARDDELDVVQGLEIGADDYVTKPFRVRELLSRVRARLRRREGTTAGTGVRRSADGRLRIDERRLRAEKDGAIVPLTAGEYRLLLVLMEHAGQTLTRDQLVDRLLGMQDAAVDDNTLSVYIRRLREKLEDDPSLPQYIITVRGVGYRYEDPL